MDELGSPSSYNHYSVGWAWATNTPFQWTKQVASHWGGTRNGTIVHWPNGIEEKGGLRSQFTHVIDIAPTILEAAGLPEPTMVNGVQQSPMEGTSMLYSFNDAERAGTSRPAVLRDVRQPWHLPQGLERGHQAPTPWVMVGGELPAFDDDVWELYDGNVDYSQAHNLVAEQPDMLAKLQRLWLIEATKYNVLPMDDRTSERARAVDGRPPDAHPRQLAAVLPRHGTAVGEQRRQHQEQVVLGHRRGRRPRRRRQRRDHRPGRPLRWLGRLRQGRQGQVRLQHARHPRVPDRCRRADPRRHATRCAWSSPTTAAASPRAATSPSTTTATPVGTGRVEHTQPMIFSADETTDIGYESGTTVTPDYTAHTSRFTGKINWVQLDVGTDDHDHFIDPEERLRIAMARQ